MHSTYEPAAIPSELRSSTLGIAWRAADIYATRPESIDAIAEATVELAAETGIDLSDLARGRAAVNDAACHLAAARIVPHRRPLTRTSWERWQCTATELWPILADAAAMAYQQPVPDGARPGRFVAGPVSGD